MVTVLKELVTDKSIDRIIVSVKQIPLSAKTVVCHVHILAEDVKWFVIDGVKEAKVVLLANGRDFGEELLAMIPLEGINSGDIVFGKIEELEYLKCMDCQWKKPIIWTHSIYNFRGEKNLWWYDAFGNKLNLFKADVLSERLLQCFLCQMTLPFPGISSDLCETR